VTSTETPQAAQPVRLNLKSLEEVVMNGQVGWASNLVLEHRLGRQIMRSIHLPVDDYREKILVSVETNPVTIIVAETGAGKSTGVPRYLAESGYRVIVTQPRRLAARTVAARVAQEMGVTLGGRVGYATGEDRRVSAETEVLFCTDGLQLVRELVGGRNAAGGGTVLVLDEVHEWNLNVEVLVAWAKMRILAGDDLRVVLMSATVAAEKLAHFMNDAPVITVPGRLYPVERQTAQGDSLIGKVVAFARGGCNVLVFQPGKREIDETVAQLRKELSGEAIVLPLHGELEPADQQRCFAPPLPGLVKVVVSTNVAQTSVTIPDIDAVVDSGLERRIELRDGIEGLYLLPISRADCEQRAGRAGRTKPGVYVLASDIDLESRPQFPKAEILRTRLDQTVLRLAAQGFDAAVMEFFHQPDREEIRRAREALTKLGAIDGAGDVTSMGHRMARLPVSVHLARMLIEAEHRGVVEQVATIAACMESGEIRARDGVWHKLTRETRSDLLAVLDVFRAAQYIRGVPGKSKAEGLREIGVFGKDYFRAVELRTKLLDVMRRTRDQGAGKQFPTSEAEREAILRSCVAGMVDHLYKGDYGRYRNGSGGDRELARESVIKGYPGRADLLVGLPFDISGKGARGRPYTLRLIGMATVVDPTMLAEVAPQLMERKPGLRPSYSPEKDVMTSVTEMFFNGQRVGEETVDDPEHPEAMATFARHLAGQPEYRQERARELNRRAGEVAFPIMSHEELVTWIATALNGARRMAEVSDMTSLQLPPLDPDTVEAVLRSNPDVISLCDEELKVNYQDGRAPRVILELDPVTDKRWLELPNELKLPGGRSVEIGVKISGYWDPIAISMNGREVTEKVQAHLNRDQWSNWMDRPQLTLPDPSDPAATVPPVITRVYGHCMVSSVALTAYGVVAAKSYTYDTQWFETRWVQSADEAERLRTASVSKLEELREQARLKAAEAQLRGAAEAACQQLTDLTSQEGYWDLGHELRQRVSDRSSRYSLYYVAVADLPTRTEETLALVAEVKSALVALAAQRAEEARLKAESEAAERIELCAIFDALIGSDTLSLDEARQIRAFAEVCLRASSGNREATIRKLNFELNANYGRDRRQNAVRNSFPGLDATDAGTVFLSLYRAEDTNRWLAGAIAWLKASTPPAAPVPKQTPVSQPTGNPEPQPSAGGLDLSKLGNRFIVRGR
jgi:hypothetical protein